MKRAPNKTGPGTEQAVLALVRDGRSPPKAAKALGISDTTVRAIMRRHGITVAPHSKSTHSPQTIAECERLLRETSLHYTEIAAQTGVHPTTIRTYAKRIGVYKYRVVKDRQPRPPSPEIEILIVALLSGGMDPARVSRRVDRAVSTVLAVAERHRETIEAARPVPEPEPVRVKPACAPRLTFRERMQALGFDDLVIRSMERLRSAPRILPVGEGV